MQRWILLSAGLFLLAGCASDKGFLPDGLSLASAAHIVTDFKNRTGSNGSKVIYITKVDGKDTTNIIQTLAPNDIYLTPGHHTIQITYFHSGMVAENSIPLSVMGGVEYYVHEQAIGYHINFWITIGKDGQIVAGTKI